MLTAYSATFPDTVSQKTKKVPVPAPAPRKPARVDGWQNASTYFGVLGKDKRLNVSYSPEQLDPETCEQLWRGNDLAARIIEVIPDEMLREGFEPTCDDRELAEEIHDASITLNATEVVREGLHTARALGGAGIFLGVDDGGKDLELPLAEDRIRSLDYITLLTPRELWANRWYADPTKPKYGEVANYRMVPVGTPPGASIINFPIVDESRIIRVSGVRTTRRHRFSGPQPGWDASILNRIVEVLSDFSGAFQGAGILATDFAVPVLKIQGLAELLATEQGQSLADRAAGIENARSIARTLILDAENESYERQTTTITGLPELLDKLMLRLAAAAKMPVSLLMGQAPAGLNATGDSDIRWFYDQISAEQERVVRPVLKRLFDIMLLAKNGPSKGKIPENWGLKFNPLWQLTEKEQADVRLVQAQVDQIYIVNQVVTPLEIGKSRFGNDVYSTETSIDLDLRDDLETDTDLQMNKLGSGSDEPVEPADPNQAQIGGPGKKTRGEG